MVCDMTGRPIPTRALAAAQAVARAEGIACDGAVVLPGSSNVMVHLRPSAVVARVMTGTAGLHGDVETWLAGEVAVGEFLGERSLAVAPADALPPGPHEHDGLWMTFWEFVEHDDVGSRPSARELGQSLRALHDALAGFRGDLPPLRDVRDWLDGLTTDEALLSRLRALTPTVFQSSLPAQAIHGDACRGNLLRTGAGLLWNDLEDVCIGPVQWDVAGLVAEARDTPGQGNPFVAEFLTAYGGIELDELEDFIEAHDLYSAIWRASAARSRARDAGG
jgi:hypothetical protein